jgi:hypothetical protein
MARKSLERQIQIRVYQWFIYQYPKYNKLCTHPPNGGRRDVREAALFKKMGVLAGVPDLVFFIARGGYHGLFIEFKLPGEKLSPHQREVIKSLKAQNYKVEVCYSDVEAIEIIKNYLESD